MTLLWAAGSLLFAPGTVAEVGFIGLAGFRACGRGPFLAELVELSPGFLAGISLFLEGMVEGFRGDLLGVFLSLIFLYLSSLMLASWQDVWSPLCVEGMFR